MIILIAFLLFLALGVPIAYVLGLSSIVYIVFTNNFILLENLAQRMFTGTDNYSLLCVPLFLLAGEVMNHGGITTRLIVFARAMVGHLRGGLAYVVVVLCTFMAAIVGSATAETAIACKMLVPEMDKDGYDRDFSAALSAAASILGPIIPPSMALVVYGVVASVSISKLFLASVVPGLLLACGFFVVVGIVSSLRQYPKQKRASFRQLLRSLFNAIPALCIPVVIFAGLFGGMFSPTETAGVTVLAALIVGCLFYRNLHLRDLPKMLMNTVLTTASVLLIVATANIFGFTLAIEQIPQQIANYLLRISENPIVILLIINVFLLFLGCFMETFSVIIIMYPVFAPILSRLGIDPLHFGVVMCFNLTIGMITPPVGLCLFVASNATGITVERIVKRIAPLFIAAAIVLFIITYVPFFSTFLPSLLNY